MSEEFGNRTFKPSNAASLIDLKAEYLTRKRDAKRGTSSGTAEVGKASVLTLTKHEKSAKAEKTQKQQDRIRHHEEALKKETFDSAQQRESMEEKARLYDRLKSGEEIVYEDGSRAEFLVNFNMKHRQAESSSDSEAEKDESRRPITPPPLIQHYDPSEEKGRIFGPSHAPLPTDEDERLQKIKELKDMSKQTENVRQHRKKQLGEQKRAEREKLRRFRAKHNMSPLPSTSEESEGEEDEQKPETSSATTNNLEPAEKRVKYGIREWDEEKGGYNRWIQKQRDERDDEFKPPTSYYRR